MPVLKRTVRQAAQTCHYLSQNRTSMENELRKRPYSRILILWITGICLAAYVPGHIAIPSVIALCLSGILLLSLSKLSRRKYLPYERRGDWGIIFSSLFLMLAFEYVYFRFRMPSFHHSSPLLSLCREWQLELLSTFDSLPLSDSEKSILGAICYGYRQNLGTEMRHQFSMAGAAHILAVSGFHVGVVYSLLRTIGKQPPFSLLPAPVIQIASLAFIWLFAAITGLAPSAIRATSMLSLVIIARIFDRRKERFNIVWASAFWMLVYNPSYLFDLGFELSYAAVLSILFFYPRINKWLHLEKLFNPVVRTAWQWFAIALAAQIGTFPLCFYYFGEISSASLLSALPITLFATLLIPLSLLWSVLSLWGCGFPLLSSCITGLTHGFLETIERMANLPPLRLHCSYSIWLSPLFYLVIIGLCFYIKKQENRCQGGGIF